MRKSAPMTLQILTTFLASTLLAIGVVSLIGMRRLAAQQRIEKARRKNAFP